MKIIIALVIVFLSACNSPQHEEHSAGEGASKYTCPMHPQVIQDKPGTCPICKMDLVLVNDKGSKNTLMLGESQIQLANISTVKVGEGSFSTSKILNGRLVINPEQSEVISSRVAGRIEELFVKETGRALSKGQPVFQVYSEQLQVLQQDYLLQLRQVSAFPGEEIYRSLRDAAKAKLRLFGYSDGQIKALERSGKVSPLVTIYAAASGVVNEIAVSEGQYVAEGSPVLRLQNLNRLWLEADIYPSEANLVSIGSNLKVAVSGFSETYTAKVDFISPALNPSTQQLSIRAVIDNTSGRLQPGMQADVFLSTGRIGKAVSLPIGAVIRDESGAHVWIRKGDEFSFRKVETGAEDASQVVLSSGVQNGEEVVVTGAYLLYSEYILKKGINPSEIAHNH